MGDALEYTQKCFKTKQFDQQMIELLIALKQTEFTLIEESNAPMLSSEDIKASIQRLSALSNHSDLSKIHTFESSKTAKLKFPLQLVKTHDDLKQFLKNHMSVSLIIMKHIFVYCSLAIKDAYASGLKGLFRLNGHLYYYDCAGQQYLRIAQKEKWTNLNGRLDEWRTQIKKYENMSDILQYTRHNLKTNMFDQQ